MFGKKKPATQFKVQTVQEYFDRLEERFVPDAAKKIDAVFQWTIRGDEALMYHVFLNHGSMTLVEGGHENADAGISIDSGDFLRIINGETEGKRLFLTGKASVNGNLKLAMKFQNIFPPAAK